MHISKVELRDIKSYADAVFHFSKGTTAITGENGAGKTTIIEAIAWVMFDLLEYKKEDLVRRGAKKGCAWITFESGLDEREYVVFRDTAASYHVTDPRLDQRIATKKEEVFRFLWQHLGLEPGTDLRSLFRQAIGVPQGTFTAIFLEGAVERKAAFDRLLKVEEYRQAAEKLRETSRFLDQQAEIVRVKIARAEGELARSETVSTELEIVTERIGKLEAETVSAADRIKLLSASNAEFERLETRFNDLQAASRSIAAEKERAELVLKQAQQALAGSEAAFDAVQRSASAAARHTEVLGLLKEFEREREQRESLRKQLADIDAAIVQVKAAKERLTDDIRAAEAAHAEIAALEPKMADQETLESAIRSLRDTLSVRTAVTSQLASLDDKLQRMRESYKANRSLISQAESMVAAAGSVPVLENRDAELHREVARLRAAIDRDEKFQSELKNGFCPILSARCLNLDEGQTLESFLTDQFTELREQVAAFELEHKSVLSDLRQAREAQSVAATLEGYRRREIELTDEGKRLTEEKARLENQLATGENVEEKLARAETALAALGDPRSRVKFLQDLTKLEFDLREKATGVESNLERLNNDRSILMEQLEAYRDLDEQWQNLSSERDATSADYRTFIANETESALVDDRRLAANAANAALNELSQRLATAEADLATAGNEYSRERHQEEKTRLIELEREHSHGRALLDEAIRRKTQLEAELQRFAEIRKSMAGEFQEHERLIKVSEATAFIRDTLKEAAPRVARNYVYHVSLEANLMYREITGNAERTLKWAEDYSIVLEENGYERPFQSLSGGEQMAAALSVRLALLKQLTDIRVAFFDEPTTNMDAERRENLAGEISRITHFDQLFVISHDETFDNYVDNVVCVANVSAHL